MRSWSHWGWVRRVVETKVGIIDLAVCLSPMISCATRLSMDTFYGLWMRIYERNKARLIDLRCILLPQFVIFLHSFIWPSPPNAHKRTLATIAYGSLHSDACSARLEARCKVFWLELFSGFYADLPSRTMSLIHNSAFVQENRATPFRNRPVTSAQGKLIPFLLLALIEVGGIRKTKPRSLMTLSTVTEDSPVWEISAISHNGARGCS
jgi:hypothetical protein